MIRHGTAPFIECSSRGERRLSAFYARPKSLNGRSIEEAYQAAKKFEDGSTNLHWKKAKGRRAINQNEVAKLYTQWWKEYLAEHPELQYLIDNASGLSDMFGRPGCVCQATVLWNLRNTHP